MLAQRRRVLNDVETIAAHAQDTGSSARRAI